MILDNIISFIKLLGINLCICYCFFRILNYKNINLFKFIFIFLINIVSSIICVYIKNSNFSFIFNILIYLSYSFFYSLFTIKKFGFSLLTMLLSTSISYIVYITSSVIFAIVETILHFRIPNIILLISISILDFIVIFAFFKIKRFKNGFQFIKNKKENDYFDLFLLIISILIIYSYIFMGNYNKINRQYLFYSFLLLVIIMLFILKKTFILYQKQKLQLKTLKEYEQELKEKDKKINSLLSEESKLVKANHEFYNRQEALKNKLTNLKNTDKNFTEEYGEILSRINTISDEYKKATTNSYIEHELPKCGIEELDDMFNYMQSECIKNNIEFIFKLNGNVHILINNIIPKERLETLIGDLIRNSIIAINHSNNKFRSIIAIIGIKNEYYEFCVYDSGIEFELNTLLKLGIQKASTHLDSGGTGIGFITTFETLKLCNSSLIITELPPEKGPYTKSITILFNNKFEYIINTYRSTKLSNLSINRNDIIIKSDFIH